MTRWGRLRRLRNLVLPAVVVLAFVGLVVSPFVHDRHAPVAAAGAVAGALILSAVALSRRDVVSVLTLMLLMLFLVPQPYVLVGPLKSVGNPAQLVGLLALALWGAGRVLGILRARPAHPVRWVLLVWAVVSMISFAAAMGRILADQESAGAIRAIFPLAASLGIAMLAIDGLTTEDMVEKVLYRLVLVGGASAAIGVVEFVSKGFSYRTAMKLPGLTSNTEIYTDLRAGFVRVAAASSHPIEYAVILAAVVPLALHFAMFGKTPNVRLTSWISLGALLAVNPMTVSRSGLLGLVVGLSVYAVHLSPRARINALIVGLIGLGLFRAAVPGLLGTLRYFVFAGSKDNSITGRTEDYARIPGLMDGHVVFGRGLGTFQPLQFFFVDNLYLLTYLEGGLVALAALVAMFVVGMSCARGYRKRSTLPSSRGLGQAIAAFIASIAAAAMAFDEFSFRQTTFAFYLVLGCAGALWTIGKEREERTLAAAAAYPDDVVAELSDRRVAQAGIARG